MKNGLPYYKAYPRDFIEGTIGMSFELKGAYRLILDLIYMQGGNLPDDARYISGLLGCTVRKWNSLRNELVAMEKIIVNGECLASGMHSDWVEQSRKDEARPSIPTSIRRAVIDRDGYVCAYCGGTGGPFHLDHILPWSRGGTHDPDNLTVACSACNLSKNDKTPDEWRLMQ